MDKSHVVKRLLYISDYVKKVKDRDSDELLIKVNHLLQNLNNLSASRIESQMNELERQFLELMLKTSVTAG
ncbi:MAG: hypothetical protein NZT61_06435 [Deltaproteobacteria bacterium]|nr:hypothetical protein [Deltaproteobacteria bacterium]MCX7953104.1 hypothetical protein [Deltaproteobacteria bacterium]